jgi:hypothetical protein
MDEDIYDPPVGFTAVRPQRFLRAIPIPLPSINTKLVSGLGFVVIASMRPRMWRET